MAHSRCQSAFGAGRTGGCPRGPPRQGPALAGRRHSLLADPAQEPRCPRQGRSCASFTPSKRPWRRKLKDALWAAKNLPVKCALTVRGNVFVLPVSWVLHAAASAGRDRFRPGGLAAGYFLAEQGYRPLIFERGPGGASAHPRRAAFDAGGSSIPRAIIFSAKAGPAPSATAN